MTSENTVDLCRQFIEILEMGSQRAVIEMAVTSIHNNRERFRVVFDMCFSEKYPLNMRASWAVQLSCEKNPSLFSLDEDVIRHSLEHENEGVRRNFLKIFCHHIDFEKIKGSGYLLNHCFQVLLDTSEKPALRVYCMQILYKFSMKEQDVRRELEEVLEFLDEEPAPSFINCKKKILRKIKAVGTGISK
jgi:hypothetical protein